jgi:D-tyrosyl-tRNA(Tyr) deacylase
MVLLIQRVNWAKVEVEGRIVGEIGKGLLVYVGFEREDSEEVVQWGVEKILGVKVFGERWERSVVEEGGEVLLISNFTLPGRLKGKKFNFSRSLEFNRAQELFHLLGEKLSSQVNCKMGLFGAMMEVSSSVDGPVNLILRRGEG